MEIKRSNLDVRMKSIFVEQNRTSSKMSHTEHLHADLLHGNLHRESSTHRPSPLQCRLSFHCCCCYCCPQLEALLDAPCASLILPAVRRLHLSFRFRVPNSVLQVAVAYEISFAFLKFVRCCTNVRAQVSPFLITLIRVSVKNCDDQIPQSSAGIPSNLNPASKEMISDSVELCETEELIGTSV